MKNKKRNPKIIFSFLICVFGFSFLIFNFAEAATLFLAPSMGTYSAGSTFKVSVKVNTEGQTINAAEATLIFDPSKLKVTDVSKTDSILSLWVSEPTFSNADGTVSFAGGKSSPGYAGSSGTLVVITFKGLSAGGTSVNFSSASVLADDGLGTSVLSSLISGSYAITERQIITTPPPPISPSAPAPSVPALGVPGAPVITSLTHSNENQWYSNNAPEFSWDLSSDITGVSLLLNKTLTANPGNTSDGLIESKNYEDVEDGIWYFHIKFRNQYGWGEIAHRKVLIDTQSPLPFEIKVQKDDPTEPQPFLLFETTDELSGIGYYEVKIGQGEPFPAERIKTESYRLPSQAPGKHSIEVKAFDKAGNFTLSADEIEISAIESPVINKLPKIVSPEESLTVEGKSLPDAAIRIFIQKKGQEPKINEVKSDVEGNWSFTSPAISEKGDYLIWAQARDKRGALSLPTDKFAVAVSLPPFLKFGKIAIDYLTTMITLIVLVIGTIAVIFYAWYRILIWRKRLRGETKEVKESVERAFRALRDEVEEQIEFLDGKPGLTKDERKVRDKLKEALNISEEFIGKEIKDIEKELE